MTIQWKWMGEDENKINGIPQKYNNFQKSIKFGKKSPLQTNHANFTCAKTHGHNEHMEFNTIKRVAK